MSSTRPDTVCSRFIRYARVHTTSAPAAKGTPSSSQQWDLARMLKGELEALGASEVTLTPYCYVLATIPGTVAGAPTIGLFAHIDTAPDYNGDGVKPILHKRWNGLPIVLPDDRGQLISIEKYPEMIDYKGCDIVTASGKTLLGADDKTGIAVIMSLVERLLRSRKIKHGPIKICFNPDEEIGRGIDKLNLKKFGAVAAYTLDGDRRGDLSWETFSANEAVVKITGVSTHPGTARSMRMVSAVMLGSRLLASLPVEHNAAETTSDRQGYLHCTDFNGDTSQAELRFLIRDFDDKKLAARGRALRSLVEAFAQLEPTAQFTTTISSTYRNMGKWISKDMRPVHLAEKAMKALGITPHQIAVRGGTDGSRLTARGLPTPNLFAGAHNGHGPHEYAVVQEMESAVDMLVELVTLWGKERQ